MSNKIPKSAVALESPERRGSRYPKPFDEPCLTRVKHVLGDQFGLDQFGINLSIMPPGAWSSQRHWHENEDEFIYVLDGELVLADESGEHVLTAGMCAGFKANNGNGHCLKNLSDKPATYLEVGTRCSHEKAHYSDVDMLAKKTPEHGFVFLHKDGSSY